ncbi:MAG TPA: sulfotransferase domain-containing protein [Tichowtungia sp.]|nr:sulfotransferase domain-containing protein [Tichowtungia sp.]
MNLGLGNQKTKLMTDLIFHIGLPKCGSSTLQRSVFRHEDGYLGTEPDIAPELNMAKQLQKCAPFAGRQTINRKGLRGWADCVRSIKQERWPNIDRLILSNEMLSSASRLSERPMIKVLSLLRQRFWTEGDIKVVLVLRNQAARLASSYAQGAGFRLKPGQADFERSVERSLNSRRHLRLFDYSRWIEGLESVAGPENFCVLLLEESRTVEFWQQLAGFCRLERSEPETMILPNTSKKNVRSRSADRWSISEFDPAVRAKVMVDKWLNAFWPTRLQSGLRDQLRQKTIAQLETRYRRKAEQIPDGRRETEFHLSPQVMETVRARCGSFNARLGEQLGRDLEPLGY